LATNAMVARQAEHHLPVSLQRVGRGRWRRTVGGRGKALRRKVHCRSHDEPRAPRVYRRVTTEPLQLTPPRATRYRIDHRCYYYYFFINYYYKHNISYYMRIAWLPAHCAVYYFVAPSSAKRN